MTRVPHYLDLPDAPLDLSGFGSRIPARHVFEPEDVEAINAALAAGRPLLVRGEPGAGKSQLARAAAVALGRAFVVEVIDARTEGKDLQWTFDAVQRLADAQVLGADPKAFRERTGGDRLDEKRYTAPGPLWWAFEWQGAADQAKRSDTVTPPLPPQCSPDHGVVVLLDEIDKADSSVPNALLGSLADGLFTAPGGRTIQCGTIEPLVVVTTNEERSLPDAFLRRCLVHQMRLPRDEQGLFEWLVKRGRAHFGDRLDEEILGRAATLLWEDRRRMLEAGLAPPGGAEYLDLLRVLAERAVGDLERQKVLLGAVSGFVLRKHPLDEGRDRR